MRLFYADKPNCHHMIEITRRVKKIYQLEAELEPYLIVDFLPNKEEYTKSFVLIEAGKEIEKIEIDLDKKEEFEKLRNRLWYYLKKYHNVKDLEDTNMIWQPTNNVIQGWQEKKRNLRNDVCCKGYFSLKSKPNHRNNIKKMIRDGFMEFIVQHWLYRDPNKPIKDKDTCNYARSSECNDNYPVGTTLWKRCKSEIAFVCKNTYGENSMPSKKDKVIKKTLGNIYKYLDENDLYVDKKKFDEIILSGLYNDVGNRLGNKSKNITKIDDTLNQVLYEKKIYLNMIEGFDGVDTSKIHDITSAKKQLFLTNNTTKYFIFVCLLLLILIGILL